MKDTLQAASRWEWLENALGEIVSLLALGGFLITLALWAQLFAGLA